MKVDALSPLKAERILEDLRKGIPPTGYLDQFTVGRRDEIEWLHENLLDIGQSSLLLKANYGSGKTHLLKLIREKALQSDFAVSLVVLDAKSGVRFNRMDQVFGAIMRSIEMPLDRSAEKGLAGCLDYLSQTAEEAKNLPVSPSRAFWSNVTANWSWDYSEELSSPPLFIALRAWAASDSDRVRNLVLDWLQFPENHKSGRKTLHKSLVTDLRRHFRDSRPDWQFYADDTLTFLPNLYQNCWSALQDFQRMFQAAGLRGVAILFDEFEDVLTNLSRINWKEAAFWNLFRFVSGDRFAGKTFFAVTPGFVQKCKQQLMEKDRWDFDLGAFDQLPMFEMSPLRSQELVELSSRIMETHSAAYSYRISEGLAERVEEVVKASANSPVQDRSRQAIRACVSVLDDELEEG